jgi:hypothetical protein
MTVLILALAATSPAGAQINASISPPVEAAGIVAADPVMERLAYLQNAWADIKYGQADKEQKLAELSALENEAAALVAQNPARPEPMIW